MGDKVKVYLLYHEVFGVDCLQGVTLSEYYAKEWVDKNPDYLWYTEVEARE